MFAKIRYWSVYTIFRWQFIFLALGMWAVYRWLQVNVKATGTDEWLRIADWLKILFWSTILLMSFSVFTLLISWIIFRLRLKRGKLKVNIRLPEDRSHEAGILPIEATIENILRPILGTIEIRIVFPQWRISDRILLDENKRTWLSPFNTVYGKAELDLHHRGLHDVEEVQIVLTDMMKLICIPITLHSQNRLLTIPKKLKEENFDIFPTATEEQDVRINIPKRVQGEFLAYKDFESGDDIRRIVWKIYARSGELVVRMPETRDPYASHVYICMGFYNELITEFDDLAGRELLNVYKDSLRQVYDAVSKNNYSVRILKDQEEQLDTGTTETSKDVFFMATANWQKDQLPSEAFAIPKAAVICLSSATPVEEIENLFGKLPMHVPVMVFALSNALGPALRFSVKNIFFKPANHPLNEVRQSWWISPLRRKLKLNEDKIKAIVHQRGNAWLMEMKPNE
jgi:hypothetical protein